MPAIKFDHGKEGAKLSPPAAPAPEASEPSKPAEAPAPIPKFSFRVKKTVEIEWVHHSRPVCYIFLIVATALTSYYIACFLAQYGTLAIQNDPHFKPAPMFKEPALTRVIMVQWLMLAFVLVTGLSIFRRIFMPLYIFLAVMATNGTLVLFVVKMKQFVDGKIDPNDLSLNLVGVLLITAIAHNLVYLYAMHMHLKRNYNIVMRMRTARAPAPTPSARVTEDREKMNYYV